MDVAAAVRMTKATQKMIASIIIPEYNQKPEYLIAAVNSALGQTLNVEVIVVDDGSKDPICKADGKRDLARTVPIPPKPFMSKNKVDLSHAVERELDAPVNSLHMPDDPRVRVVRLENNCGIAEALNTGIREMRTDYFCWLSSDDLRFPTSVEKNYEALLATGKKCCFHSYEVIGLDGNSMNSKPIPVPHFMTHEEQKQQILNGCWINGSTCMIHKSVFDDVGMFDPSYRWSQDYETWIRITQKYEWAFLDEPLGMKREGGLGDSILADPERARIWAEEDARAKSKYKHTGFCPPT